MTTLTMLNEGTSAKSGPTQPYAIGLKSAQCGAAARVAWRELGRLSWPVPCFSDQRIAVATFCNLTTSRPDSLARKVVGIYLADRIQPRQRPKLATQASYARNL